MATKMPGPDTDIPWVQEEKKGTGEAHIHSYNYVVFCVRTNSICFGHIKMFLVRLGWVFGLFFLRRWAYSVVGLGFLLGLVS